MSQDNGRLRLERVDPSKLKLREIAELERVLGRKLGAEFTSGDLGIDTLQGLVWLQARKQDPDVTFEQAGEFDLGTLIDALSDEDDEPWEGGADPTPGTPSVPATSAASPASGNSKLTPSSTTSGG